MRGVVGQKWRTSGYHFGRLAEAVERAQRGAYLVHDVLERVGAVNGETDENDVGLGVGERSQAVVLFLSGRVPERELDHLACGRMRGVCDVVLEDGGHVFLRGISISSAMVGRSGRRRVGLPLGNCRSCS